jgi:hypothetical protein
MIIMILSHFLPCFNHLKAEINMHKLSPIHPTSVHSCVQYHIRETCFGAVDLVATLRTRIRKVVGSNFGRNTGCPNCFFFHDFPQCLQTITGTVHRLGHDQFLSNPFQFIIRYPDTRRYAVSTLKASLNSPCFDHIGNLQIRFHSYY